MFQVHAYDLKGSVRAAVTEVFDTMLDMQPELMADTSTSPVGARKLVAAVSFSGEILGTLYVHLDASFAHAIAAGLLDWGPDDPGSEEEMHDVLREVANMLGGKLKSEFCDADLACQLSVPVVTSGGDFCIEILNVSRHEQYAFVCQPHAMNVEVCLKTDNAFKPLAPACQHPVDLQTFDLRQATADAVGDVFQTMLSMDIRPTPRVSQSGLAGAKMVGAVSFTGDVQGFIQVQVSDEFADLSAATLLATEGGSPIREDVFDVIRELSNMIGGKLKSGLCDAGWPCMLTVPYITAGCDFIIQTLNLSRHERFAFCYRQHLLFVEIGLKPT